MGLATLVCGQEIDLNENHDVACWPALDNLGDFSFDQNQWEFNRNGIGIMYFSTREFRSYRRSDNEQFSISGRVTEDILGWFAIDDELDPPEDDRRVIFQCTGGEYLRCANFDDSSQSLGVFFVLNLSTFEGFVSRVLNPVEYETKTGWRQMYNKREGARLGDDLNTQIKSKEYLNSPPVTALNTLKCRRRE